MLGRAKNGESVVVGLLRGKRADAYRRKANLVLQLLRTQRVNVFRKVEIDRQVVMAVVERRQDRREKKNASREKSNYWSPSEVRLRRRLKSRGKCRLSQGAEPRQSRRPFAAKGSYPGNRRRGNNPGKRGGVDANTTSTETV